jgi:hypothetical protein
MKLESLLSGIAEYWHGDFTNFVQTGDASPKFLQYLDGDPEAQKAVETAFTEQARALEGLAQLVKNPPAKPQKASPAEGVSASVARAFERIGELSGEERANAITVASETLSELQREDSVAG